MGDWPIKEYLKRHFSNQQNYRRRVERRAKVAQIKGKGKATERDGLDDWFDFESEVDTSDKEGQEEEF